MPPLPPPPPPAPPPPLPTASSSSSSSGPGLGPSGPSSGRSSNRKASGGGGDRNALLSDIRHGTRLKKTTQVNDRSAPVVGNTASSNGPAKASNAHSSSSSGGSVPMQLGGLFSQGMPKLRATGNKLIPERGAPSNMNQSTASSRTPNRGISGGGGGGGGGGGDQKSMVKSSIKASLEQQLNIQQNKSKTNMPAEHESDLSASKNKFNTVHGNRTRRTNSSFPSDVSVNIKGPAPSVPTKLGPPLPSKPPTVHRSHSQSVAKNQNKQTSSASSSNNRPGPPPMKPPPPPKANGNVSKGNPNLLSKPAVGVNRRQSFGGNDTNQFKNFSEVSQPPAAPPPPPPPNNSLKPPPPPRNNSVPNGLSHHHSNPPIPPPTSTIPSRTNALPVATVSPLPQTPKLHSSSPRPPLGPPPPPPHRNAGAVSNTAGHNSYVSSHGPLPAAPPPPPPSLPPPNPCKVVPSSAKNGAFFCGPSGGAPAPPQRNTSISRTDLESRFSLHFKEIQLLPAPDSFTAINKVYPSTERNRSFDVML